MASKDDDKTSAQTTQSSETPSARRSETGTAGDEQAAKDNQAAADEVGADQVQERFDEANEKGFFGESPDDTPRENYTVEGVGKGAPTPENPDGGNQ